MIGQEGDAPRRVTLERPASRNALDAPMVRALLAALRATDATGFVLAGAGGHFCAGADLREAAALHADPPAREARMRLTAELLALPATLPRPVAAAVRGAAAGAGAGLAMACDHLVLHPGARLSFPEARHGLLPALVAPILAARLPALLVLDLLAAGRVLTAAECAALGFAEISEEPEMAAAAWCVGAATLAPSRYLALKRLALGRPSMADGVSAWLGDARMLA